MSKIAIVTMAALLILTGGVAASAAKSSVSQGEKLFNDPGLGGSANQKSCNSCHPAGEGLSKAGARKDLVKMINNCITGPLEGEKIDGRKVEMRSLKLYIESLAK